MQKQPTGHFQTVLTVVFVKMFRLGPEQSGRVIWVTMRGCIGDIEKGEGGGPSWNRWDER